MAPAIILPAPPAYGEYLGVREKNLLEVIQNRDVIKRKAEDLGLKIINFCPIFPDLVSFDDIRREKALDLFSQGIELASYFECETVQIDSFTPSLEFVGETPYGETVKFGKEYKVKIDPNFKWEKQWAVLVESVKRCTVKVQEFGLKLAMEPRVGELISNTDGLLRLIDAIGNDRFGVILDTGHLNAKKEILPLSVEKLSDRIFCVHISNNDGRDNRHLGMNKGNIDWDGIFIALKKHRFNGYITMDIGVSNRIEQNYIESKEILESYVKRYGL